MNIRDELERIRNANDGVLRPLDVVEAARPKRSPLHDRFEWDDSEAANAYRLEQARRLIRCVVLISTETGKPTETRCYVSLDEDRGTESYRHVVDVMKDPQRRAKLLDQARREMESFEARYHDLEELSAVIAAIRKTRASSQGLSAASAAS